MATKKLLLNLFEQHCSNKSNIFDKKINENIRIMTFNVHAWTDFKNKYSFTEIFTVIEESNADIVGLQEAVFFGKSSFIKSEFIKCATFLGYKYHKMCNDKYGINILLSKYKIIEHNIIKLVKDINNVKSIQRYAVHCKIQINDTKYINVTLVHLDVYDETELTRYRQMSQILSEIPTESIIIGDLNSLRKKDYSKKNWNHIVQNDLCRNVKTVTLVTDLIKKNLYFDSFEICFETCPNVSVWTMRRVDYIYVSLLFPFTIRTSKIYPTLVSDHYPIYVDIVLQ